MSLRCRGMNGDTIQHVVDQEPLELPVVFNDQNPTLSFRFPFGKGKEGLEVNDLHVEVFESNSLLIGKPIVKRGWNLEQLEHLFTRDAELTPVDLEHRHVNRWS